MGANVTVLDNSPEQLSKDREVARRENLEIITIQGDMSSLDSLEDQSFDLIFHPISNCFVPDVIPVWKEAYRVLRFGGRLLSGFINPLLHIFDYRKMESNILEVKYSIPYSDLEHLTSEELKSFQKEQEPLWFGHSLEDQIRGQLNCGFMIADFFEDSSAETHLCNYIPVYAATLSIKLKHIVD